MSTPTRSLQVDFGCNDIADHSSTDQRSVVTTNADIKHNSAVNTPQYQLDLNVSVDLDSTATTTAHGGSSNITSTTSISFSDILQKESATLPPHGNRYSEIPGQTQITDEVINTPNESHVPCESEAFNQPQDPIIQVKPEPELTIQPEPAVSAQPSRIQPLDSPPQVLKVEHESPIQNEHQTRMEPVTSNQTFYSPVHETDTGLRSPIEDDHIKFAYPTLDHNVLSSTAGKEHASYNQLEHPANSQTELPSLNQPGHTPLELPSFSQLASSTFMSAQVELPPLGLLPHSPLIKPKSGLFTHPQPDLVSRSQPALVPNFGIPFTSQFEFNAPSHNELPVRKVPEPVSYTEPSRVHGPQALGQVNLKPALRGSPQPVSHSGHEPPTEPGPAAHSEPRLSAHHTIDAEVDSMSGLFSSGSLNVSGTAAPTPSKNPFEFPAPARSRKKKVPSGRAASLTDMASIIQGNNTLTETVKQVAEAPLGLTDGVSAKLPSKKYVEIGAEKINAECAAGDIDAKSAVEKVTGHPTAKKFDESLTTKQITGIPAENPMCKPGQSPAEAPPETPTETPTEAPIAKVSTGLSTEIPVEVPVRKKDPRGRKPKAKTNPEGVTKSSKSAPKKKAIKATESGESSNTPTIKKSKRQADKQALLKAAAEEEERQAAAMSIRLVEERITMEAEHARQLELAQKVQAEAIEQAGHVEEIRLGQPDEPSPQVLLLQQDEPFQQAESSQQIPRDVGTNSQPEIIHITDTEIEVLPKKPVKKKLVKKAKKNPTKARTIGQEPLSELVTMEETMLEPIQTGSHSKKQAFSKDISVGHSRRDANDEYVPDKNVQPTFKTLTTGRKKRAAATSVSYKDYDLDEIEEEAPRKKREKNLNPKVKEALSSSSKPVKAVVARPKRSSGKTIEVEENGPLNAIYIDTDDEVKETEIAQIETSKLILTQKSSDAQDNKLMRLLQSKDSKLVQANFRQLIPEWLAAFSEKDKQELALLLPEPDQVIKNKNVTIRSDFGQVSTNHCYEAAEKWQDILFLGGFDPENKSAAVNVEDDSFKDDNYEQHWGDRIIKFNEEKRKREEAEVGHSKVKKAKGKGKASNTRRGRPPK
ncbi:hypothetical protein INT47_013031 [Mucor saturninus]|uniref:ASX DEUBAD domain-containing protein n=1 Tax=Mucor saturninus TaxID=64648 RepID=A0A8H7QZP7_9FUNG|nr:hypothetical protein INT47_013031 [Mucor saturninus]